MARQSPSYRLSDSDREKLIEWTDIIRPEPEQILPVYTPTQAEEREISAAERLANTKILARRVLSKITELQQKVDKKCNKFKVSSDQGVGSPLYQAMVRVFNEKTTTVTYDHYKRALEYRQQLAEEDTERLKVE